MAKKIPKKVPAREWIRRRIGVILLIIALTAALIATMVTVSNYVPVDDICLIVDLLIIVLTISGYILVRVLRIPAYHVRWNWTRERRP